MISGRLVIHGSLGIPAIRHSRLVYYETLALLMIPTIRDYRL